LKETVGIIQQHHRADVRILFVAAGLALFLLSAGLSLADANANRTITPICAIQGDYFTTDYAGQVVKTQGVVFADFDSTSRMGFFIQNDNCDGDPATSDGIFVDLGEQKDVVQAGDGVEVQGVAREDYGNTVIDVITGTVTVIASGTTLPEPHELRPPADNKTSRWYFESIESMAVALDDARVVGPTDSYGNTWVARNDLGIQRVFQDDVTGTGEVICIGDSGLYSLESEATVGDRLLNVSGVLEYGYGDYCVQLMSPSTLVTSTINTDSTRSVYPAGQSVVTLATLNLHNMFDTVDDPATDDSVLGYPTYVRRLQKNALLIHDVLGEPDLLAVEEVEHAAVLEDLAACDDLQADYRALLVEGPDLRGQDVALLYRSDRAAIVESQVYQGCTTLVDGLGVDGNQDVYNPANAMTCDADGDGVLDGNRLFSRPPLRVRVKVCVADCSGRQVSAEWVELTLLIDHFKSKFEDGYTTLYTQPRRNQEAQFIADLAQSLHAAEPDTALFVMGDLNDFPTSQPLVTLKAAGLRDLTQTIDHDERFTYNYQGVSQVLDYVLYYPAPGLMAVAARALHVNADYPYAMQSRADTYHRSSDHDPLLVTLLPLPYREYFPLGVR
jgi:predicted extracellular nuclease